MPNTTVSEIRQRLTRCSKGSLVHFAATLLAKMNDVDTLERVLRQLEHNTVADKQRAIMKQAERLGMTKDGRRDRRES